jgi:hypothetical protein
VRRYDETAGDEVGDRRAVIAAYQVQAQVHRGGLARGGEHPAVVDVEHIRVDLHEGVTGGELAGMRPVGGGAQSVEQAGGGQHEGAGTQGDHPRP